MLNVRDVSRAAVIKNEEIKLLSSSTDMLDLSHWEEDINYRANKVSQAVFMGGGPCRRR